MSEERTEIQRLQSAVEELRIINNLIDRICRVRETNHIMEIIIAELVQLTASSQGLISLVSTIDEDDLVTVVRNNRDEADSLDFHVSDLISGYVLREKKLLRVDDLDSDERFTTLNSNDGRNKSIICCPMVVRDQIVGLVTLIRSDGAGPFDDDRCRLVGIIASQSAHQLYSARLLEDLAEKNRLLDQSRRQLADENSRLQVEVGVTFAFENIIGKSAPMKKVLSLTSRFSTNDAPVLITGDTGTGKELIARAIHYNGRRKDRPFVIKNCGVKTETLLESELFGHVKGAFTGADKDKPGLFKQADGGTIFLDEIGEAPAPTQVAILRALESGEVRPVGSTKTEFVDVRIISATNRDLAVEIESGNFRRDLFYRLNTFTINLPPLSHRPDDIALLVHHFLAKLKIKLAQESLSISPEALTALTKYSWPGNIRQLENELERAAVVSDFRGTIKAGDLSPEIRQAGSAKIDAASYRGPLKDAVQKLEADLIRAALDEHEGNIMQTSKMLGLTRKGLKDKMERYKIDAHDSKEG